MVGVYGIHVFFFSSRRRHTRYWRDWSSDVCSSDLQARPAHHDAQVELAREHAGDRRHQEHEIGRASCRERSVDLGGRRIIKKKKVKSLTSLAFLVTAYISPRTPERLNARIHHLLIS